MAAIVLAAAGMVLVPTAWRARKRPVAGRSHVVSFVWEQTVPYAVRLRAITAAALSLGAAVIQLAIAPGHLAEDLPFGAAFLVVGIAQMAAAVAIMAFGADRVRVPVILFAVGVLSAWGWSRIAGLPIGPEPWIPEHAGTADLVAGALEGTLILVLLAPIERLTAGASGIRAVDAMSVAVVPVIGTIGIATLVAVASLGAFHL